MEEDWIHYESWPNTDDDNQGSHYDHGKSHTPGRIGYLLHFRRCGTEENPLYEPEYIGGSEECGAYSKHNHERGSNHGTTSEDNPL